MINLQRKPVHPGEILREEFLIPLGITQTQLAVALGTTAKTINEITNERRNISSEMAVKLALFLGTTVELWLNLQNQFDIYKVYSSQKEFLKQIRPFKQNKIKAT